MLAGRVEQEAQETVRGRGLEMDRTAGPRRRSQVIALGVTAVMAASSLAACGDRDEPEYAGVCVDPRTQVRLEDEQCRCLDPETGEWDDDDQDCRRRGSDRTNVGWYFIPYGVIAAGVGQRVAGGGFSPPQNRGYSAGGVPRAGGTVSRSSVKGGTTISRGGFGSRGGGIGG